MSESANGERIEIIRFDESTINKISQDCRMLEYRTELKTYRSFDEIQHMMNGKFNNKDGKLSTILDIISMYLRGQKLLYLESKSLCEFYLHRLMMPCIFLSSLCSVISGVFNEIPDASKAIAGATAFNAFLMSIISYFKLDARAEAHKMTAYSFDQLISECEFTSGKILLSNTSSDASGEQYDISYIQRCINDIEVKVKEIKEKNQFMIPDTIRNRFPFTYNTNIFTIVKDYQIDEMKMINKLKILYNTCVEIDNKIIIGDRTEATYEKQKQVHLEKEKYIENIIDNRKNIGRLNADMHHEIMMNRKKSCFSIIY